MTPKDVTEDVEQQVRPIRSRSSWLTLGRSLQGDNKGVVRHVEAFHRRTCFVHVVLAGGLGGAAIGGPVEDVLPVVLDLPLSNTAAEAFGVRRSAGSPACSTARTLTPYAACHLSHVMGSERRHNALEKRA